MLRTKLLVNRLIGSGEDFNRLLSSSRGVHLMLSLGFCRVRF